MQKSNFNSFNNQNSWFDCLGELKQESNCSIQDFSSTTDSSKTNDISKINNSQQIFSQQNDQNNDLINTMLIQKFPNKGTFKRLRPSYSMEEQIGSYQTENYLKDQFNEDKKEELKKQVKQNIYSKNYRNKKKQQFKALQQENQFLKKKVQDLHLRLRQLQIQISRLKKYSKQKQLTIQELNQEFLKAITFISEKIQDNIDEEKEKQNSLKKPNTVIQRQFIQCYDEQGFSGSKKKLILDYHMNEMLQVVLRDSEKYLCMLCCKNKDESFEVQMPEYQKINTAFFEIMELNESDMQRLNSYVKFLFPAMKQIKKECSDMYRNYSKIIQSMDRVHYLMKSTYIQNIDFVIKRMKVESWFEYHKYHRMMRRLKNEWIQFVKSQNENEVWENQNIRVGHKRNNFQQIMIY